MIFSGDGSIETDSTVREIVARYPETLAVFNRFGLDSCCGGGIPLRDAAPRHGADLDELLRSLREAIRDDEAPSDSLTRAPRTPDAQSGKR